MASFFPETAKKGFTLVEMLVVVAIIAMLVSGTIAFFQQARAKSRDATREEQIKTLQNALALFATQHGVYPVYNGVLDGSDVVSTQLVVSDALPAVPKDPLNRGVYQYSYTSANGATYTITYYLETNTIPGKPAGMNRVGP